MGHRIRLSLVGEFRLSAGGVGRYSIELGKQLEKRADVCYIGRKETLNKAKLKLFGLKLNNCDLVHATFPSVAKINTCRPLIVTYHDSMFITRYAKTTVLQPKNYIHKILERSSARYNFANADAIISVSSIAQKEMLALMKSFKINMEDKTYEVINNGLSDIFIKAKPGARRKDFIYIGTVHLPHKNFGMLLEVFSKIADSDPNAKLHIFTPTKREIAEKIIEDKMIGNEEAKARVIIHQNEPDEKLVEQLRHSVALLHLSKEEGFGITILEAMAVGTPVLTLKDALIPEEVRKFAFKGSVDEIESQALRLLANPQSTSKNAINYAKSFTWGNAAEKALNLYKKILKKHNVKCKM
ncbi:MAG: glycosyltransferase [Candidatus Micrarchaeaceae archaeon]